MIMKSIQSSIRQLCFARNSFGFVFINYDVKQYDYDALISDIDSDDLYGQISIRLGKNNLSPLSPGEQEFEKIRYGIIYGNLTRGIISLPSRFQNKTPIWIHYLIDTASPWTFLSNESLKALINPSPSKIHDSEIFGLKLNGIRIKAGVSKPGFESINILGMDYLGDNKLVIDGPKKNSYIQFSNEKH